MKTIICAVRDLKSNVFALPFSSQTKGSAIRSFDDEVNRADRDNMLHNHPEDFQLFMIGEYNDNDATIVSETPIKLLVSAIDVFRDKNTVKNISKV